MELYLQFGHGMIAHTKHLIENWGGGTVVLSPRDLTAKQMESLATAVRKYPNGAVLLDPQFYLPHADHERLCSHDYWPAGFDSSVFWQGPELNALLTSLIDLNDFLGTREFILPGILATSIDDDWLEIQRSICDEARSFDLTRPVLATIALSADSMKDYDQVGLLIEDSANWDVEGFYVVLEHPNGSYLVEDPNWLATALDLCAGLKLTNAKVVLGYASHQLLPSSASRVDAICSGTWMNVRSFPPDKFVASLEDEIKKRTKWYYCPMSLSEYKITFLDLAQRQGVLADMKALPFYGSNYADVLFSGVLPSTINFTEGAAFRHYLQCLKVQCQTVTGADFDSTLDALRKSLDEAETLSARLSRAGISGQLRDFRDLVDVSRGALAAHENTRGAILRRKWSRL